MINCPWILTPLCCDWEPRVILDARTKFQRQLRSLMVSAKLAAPGIRARMPGILVALLSLCTLAAKHVATTQPSYRVDSWDTQDGMPENSATAMFQDRAGHLWL